MRRVRAALFIASYAAEIKEGGGASCKSMSEGEAQTAYLSRRRLNGLSRRKLFGVVLQEIDHVAVGCKVTGIVHYGVAIARA